jgi:DNA helicase INO80
MPQQESFVQTPSSFKGTLKSYQVRGLNWLLNLYDQGINGILADEMGLGKTVQSIAFLSYLAGSKDVWGPFLIVAPNSTLHQWQQEVSKFCPELRVLPYWGAAKERQILRQSWSSKLLSTRAAPFHVLITSYNAVVADEKYFHRMRFRVMVLDEAQAIKNAASQRWKCLLNLKCRNRVLLTGTPIQNCQEKQSLRSTAWCDLLSPFVGAHCVPFCHMSVLSFVFPSSDERIVGFVAFLHARIVRKS